MSDKQLWSNERIRKELEDCEQGADVDGLIFTMRDSYEKEFKLLRQANMVLQDVLEDAMQKIELLSADNK